MQAGVQAGRCQVELWEAAEANFPPEGKLAGWVLPHVLLEEN